MLKVFGFFLKWLFTHPHQLLMVLFQTLLILFLTVLGFSEDLTAHKHLPSIFLICMFFMGQFFFMETHSRFSFERTLQGLILTGMSPHALYISILLTSLLILTGMEGIILTLISFFFHVTFTPTQFLLLWFIGLLGTLSYVALGTLYYGFSVFSKIPLSFMMVLFFPICIPLFLQMHTALESVLSPTKTLMLQPLFGMALLFVFLCGLLYEWISETLW